MICPDCNLEMCGVQYGRFYSETETEYGHPEHYDGVSEWRCRQCKKRYGAWSKKVLSEGEYEPRYGVKK